MLMRAVRRPRPGRQTDRAGSAVTVENGPASAGRRSSAADYRFTGGCSAAGERLRWGPLSTWAQRRSLMTEHDRLHEKPVMDSITCGLLSHCPDRAASDQAPVACQPSRPSRACNGPPSGEPSTKSRQMYKLDIRSGSPRPDHWCYDSLGTSGAKSLRRIAAHPTYAAIDSCGRSRSPQEKLLFAFTAILTEWGSKLGWWI